MIKKIILPLAVGIFSVCSLNAAQTIKGNVADQSTSFDFNINNPALTTFTRRGATVSIVFTSAAATPTDPEFTIARSSSINPFGNEPFVAMSPESANVNGEPDTPNPIRGNATSNLTISGSRLALVRNNLPAQVFMQGNIFGAPSTAQIFTTRGVNINDAAGATSAGVQALAANGDKFVFAAVAPNGDVFGGGDTGIALLKLDSDKVPVIGNPDKPKLIPFLDVPNANDGTKGGNLPVRFDVTTSQLRIGSALASIADVVDMHWDSTLKRLYIVTTATSAADGVRAVVIGRLLGNSLIFDGIAPIGVFSGTDQIVGTTGAATVSLSHVKTMHTTTGLSYLIVAGNNGLSSATGNVIFAVPLVDKSNSKDFNTDATHGTLADINSTPTTFFMDGFFKARAFTTPATASGDVLINTDTAAMVGAGTLPLDASSRISDLFVVNDAVFAAIQTDYDGGTTEPGLYKSQAIFDQNGVITAWTAWKRVAGTDALIQGAALDARSNSFVYLPTNSAGTVSNTMKRTAWSLGDTNSGAAGLAILLGDNFEKVQGGVQGLFDFPRNTTTFTATAADQLALLVATGFGKITLIETARTEPSGDFKPFFGSFSGITSNFTDGTIGTTFATGGSTRAIVMSGGDVTNLGPISAAEVATDGSEGFLAIGGVGGLAALTKPDGSGWSSLTDGFGGLTSGMKFFEVNDYSFVRKLVADGTNLYVLTNKTLDRIDMMASNFATGVLAVTTLATPESIGLTANDSFSDTSVSGEVGLLATSQGLFRVGNGQDVSSGASATLDWTKVSIPNAPGPATRLSFGTTTGMNKDFKTNSQLYLLAAFNGYDQAQLNRYIINFDATIDDDTVQLVPDLILTSPTFLMTFGAFRNFLLDDGALVTSTRSRNNGPIDDFFIDPVTGLTQEPELKREAFVKFTQNKLVAQEPSFAKASADRQIKVPFNFETTSNIANTVRSVASGAILVPGDFGLRVND